MAIKQGCLADTLYQFGVRLFQQVLNNLGPLVAFSTCNADLDQFVVGECSFELAHDTLGQALVTNPDNRVKNMADATQGFLLCRCKAHDMLKTLDPFSCAIILLQTMVVAPTVVARQVSFLSEYWCLIAMARQPLLSEVNVTCAKKPPSGRKGSADKGWIKEHFDDIWIKFSRADGDRYRTGYKLF